MIYGSENANTRILSSRRSCWPECKLRRISLLYISFSFPYYLWFVYRVWSFTLSTDFCPYTKSKRQLSFTSNDKTHESTFHLQTFSALAGIARPILRTLEREGRTLCTVTHSQGTESLQIIYAPGKVSRDAMHNGRQPSIGSRRARPRCSKSKQTRE